MLGRDMPEPRPTRLKMIEHLNDTASIFDMLVHVGAIKRALKPDPPDAAAVWKAVEDLAEARRQLAAELIATPEATAAQRQEFQRLRIAWRELSPKARRMIATARSAND